MVWYGVCVCTHACERTPTCLIYINCNQMSHCSRKGLVQAGHRSRWVCVCMCTHACEHTPTCLLLTLILIRCQKAPLYNFQFQRKPSAENLRISTEPSKHRSRFNALNTKENSPLNGKHRQANTETEHDTAPRTRPERGQRVGRLRGWEDRPGATPAEGGDTGPGSSEAPPLESESEQRGREAAPHGHTGAWKADGGTNTWGDQWSTTCSREPPPTCRDCLALNVTGKARPAPANRNREPLFLPYFFLISSCLNFISALLKQRNLV